MTSNVKCAVKRTTRDLRAMVTNVLAAMSPTNWPTWHDVRSIITDCITPVHATIWEDVRVPAVICGTMTLIVAGASVIFWVASECIDPPVGALVAAPFVVVYMIAVMLFGVNYVDCIEEETNVR